MDACADTSSWETDPEFSFDLDVLSFARMNALQIGHLESVLTQS